ncbi:MAG: UDP-4-amino-4,6-dideoxy-N-acetyl-beta-L-altrosamine transaminase [Nitrospiraceae bacterium]|nr:UDP-4-amino-4,6-dideoxy-N-acetyl-beta-L-altrosamine transaminase [Nitrospiraceae bacterium]
MSSPRGKIPYSRQSIDEDDIREVVAVLRSDYLTQGPKIRKFEAALASYCGARYAVVFSSGTAALHGAYFAAGIGAGDEIITSPITFVATSNAALYLGARPVFADVDPATGNIDPELIEKAITGKTKAIVPVDYAGNPVQLDIIRGLAERRGIKVIEDGCHALGASYRGKKIGSISDMTAFSFHPVKPIATGEGGAVLTNDEKSYEKLLAFRTHGISQGGPAALEYPAPGGWYYEMQFLGFNYRLTDIQCALGLSQLRKLDGFIKRRGEIARSHEKAFTGNKWFDLPVVNDDSKPSWHLYPIRFKDEFLDEKPVIFDRLRKAGLVVQVHYLPAYFHPYYRRLGYREGICPKAEEFYKRELSIPVYHGMDDADVETVHKTVFNALREL